MVWVGFHSSQYSIAMQWSDVRCGQLSRPNRRPDRTSTAPYRPPPRPVHAEPQPTNTREGGAP